MDMIRTEQSQWQQLWYQHRKNPFQFIVEEMITGENGEGKIPFDYRLYTFDGEVRFIIQVDRNTRPRSLAFFLNEFELFDYSARIESDWTSISRGEHRIPGCHREIVTAAKKISRVLCTPFVSVDIYATLSGPLIGELGIKPGEAYRGKVFKFKPQFDEELGTAWAQANARLGRPMPVLDIDLKLMPPSISLKNEELI